MNIKRYNGNPILEKNDENGWENYCVLNPGVIYDEERKKFIMLYRAGGDDLKHEISVGIAESDDGFNFTRVDNKPFISPVSNFADGECIEDPRISIIDGLYYITYAGRFRAVGQYWLEHDKYVSLYGEPKPLDGEWPLFIKNNHTVTYLAITKDFKDLWRIGRITDSRVDDRDVYLFNEKVNGKYVKISRPKFQNLKECPKPSIWISFSDDVLEWGKPQLLMKGEESWETERIGGCAPPIKTDSGFIMLYHGIGKMDNGKEVYRVGAVLLDKDDPTKILKRTKQPIFVPQEEYERKGLFGECVFPTATIVKDGVVFIYYGCADQLIGVATVELKELEDYLRNE